MLWGDLCVNKSRLIWDAVVIGSWTCSSFIGGSCSWMVASLMLSLWSVYYVDHGYFLRRWPIMSPIYMLVIFQSILFVLNQEASSWFKYSSIFCLLLSTFNGVFLFPPFDLPSLSAEKKKYHVGIMDSVYCCDNQISIRIFYPATPTKEKMMPYLDVNGLDMLRELVCMTVPWNEDKKEDTFFSSIFYGWSCGRIPNASKNASPLDANHKWPCIVYSHGLFGNSHIYTYAPHAMAERGYIVVSITHSDGSAVGAKSFNGSPIPHDTSFYQIKSSQDTEKARQTQILHRIKECQQVTNHLQLHSDNILTKTSAATVTNIKLSIDVNKMILMGHSYGGATVLATALQDEDGGKKSHFKGIVAHDPATLWMPDTERQKLYNQDHSQKTLLLYSQSWHDLKWGGVQYCKDAQYVKGTNHSDFSDTSFLLPLWLAQGVLKMTGPRPPTQSAIEIMDRTAVFCQSCLENKQT